MNLNLVEMRWSERWNGSGGGGGGRTMRTSRSWWWWWCVVVTVVVMGAVVVRGDYTHEWAVHVEGGDDGVAEDLARRHDFDVAYKVFDDVYVLRHRRLAKRSADPSPHHHQRLVEDPAVRWAEQQQVKRRVKRDYLSHITGISYPTARLNDAKWPLMWYLNRGGSLDMNVQAAWAAGATGKGVVVTILDDGLEKDHPDLIKNYDPNASYDVNNHDPDPMPRYDLVDSNRHGTRCAGEVAADANNSICAVGVAYEASVGGVRMLDGDVTDAVEARSLALNPQHIDIYSASWGPDDDGKTVDGPGQLATRAFVEGIRNGRGGKGSIFIWASGNGGRDQDNCNCDGYTNSIWTLSISSATEKGQVPWYSEACSSTLATTYSSGSLGESQIITTDLHHSCTTSHTGTSASAPLAAGICALALQVNRDITWRDMQHIVVRTARPENLEAPDWQINGVGRRVSHRFGYGLMDTYGMVKLARNWTSVPAQRTCDVEAPHIDKLIPQKSFVSLELDVTDCPGVNFLEHVQAKVSLTADRRGDIEIYLSSPAGTKSTLLAQRPHDSSRSGFHNWPFMTVHMWGERPLGKWVLEVHNNGHFFTTGTTILEGWELIFHGTKTNHDTWQSRGGRRDRGGGGRGSVVGRRGGGGSTVPYRRNHSAKPSTTPPTTTTTTTTTTTSPSTTTSLYPYLIGKYPRPYSHSPPKYPPHPNPKQYPPPHYPPQDSLPGHSRLPNHRDSSHHKGKAGVKDWSLTMYGTESEPGQAVPSLVEDQLHSHISHSDSTLHQVVDTTEGKTETRDPGSQTPGHPSTPSSATRPASVTPLPVPLEKVLSVGCLRSSAVGACLECKKDLYIFNGQCLKTCSAGHYPYDPQQEGVTGAPTCHTCHYSCHNCSGPQDYECTECWGDAELYSPSKGQNLCQPRSLLQAFRRQESWYMALVGVVMGLVVLVVVLGILVLRRSKKSSFQHSITRSPPMKGAKPAVNGKISYSLMPHEAQDKLLTSVPFHDLTTDDEEEND